MEAKTSSNATPKGYNAVAFSFIRDEWVEKQMATISEEFTTAKEITVACCTWNVNAKKPSENLDDWLQFSETESPDIYAIGFQEIVDLNAVNLLSLTDHTASKPWEEQILQSLRGSYYLAHSQHLVGLALLVFVKDDLRRFVRDIEDNTVGVGVMGVGGNKGAVSIRLRLHDSTFCFVNSHLAAHKGNVEGRNSDYRNIMERTRFVGPTKPSTAPTQSRTIPTSVGIKSHDYVFWIGDLNYRLNLNDLEEVHRLVAENSLDDLLVADQLILEKHGGRAFVGFEEGQITFAPTYKFQPGTDLYERREDKKKRFPAWCDRIQWIKNADVQQLCYRKSDLKCSDHKPVSALFAAKAKIVVEEKRRECYQRLVRQLDAWENESLPRVDMSQNAVHFEDVSYDEAVSKKLTIKNTGSVIVKFTFIPKLQEEAYCKRWLSVEPQYGVIPPDQSCDITLTVHVTRTTAHALNTGEDSMEDILIFRLENGRDYFITITGNYLRSCFGSTLEYLVKCEQPVRYANNASSSSRILSIPKEMWRLVDFLFRHGMDEEKLFLEGGDARQRVEIREMLDLGHDFEGCEVQSVAETLVQFLSSLAEPVFPASLCESYDKSVNITAWCKQTLMALPAHHYNAFIYITSFLRELLRHNRSNMLNVENLVVVFAAALMHFDVDQRNTAGLREKPNAWIILRHFLTSDDFS